LAELCNRHSAGFPLETQTAAAAPIFLFALIAGVVIVGLIFSIIAGQKRREALAQLAARLGLTFSPGNDSWLAGQFGFLDKLAQGSNRYAYNVLRGIFQGHEVLVFDYHYETYSTDSKSRR
jgi:hypothetical protein